MSGQPIKRGPNVRVTAEAVERGDFGFPVVVTTHPEPGGRVTWRCRDCDWTSSDIWRRAYLRGVVHERTIRSGRQHVTEPTP